MQEYAKVHVVRGEDQSGEVLDGTHQHSVGEYTYQAVHPFPESLAARLPPYRHALYQPSCPLLHKGEFQLWVYYRRDGTVHFLIGPE